MGVKVRPDGLQIEEIPGFHQRWWKAKRVAWIICLLILGAAIAGLFGDGPLSKATERSKEGNFSVEYQRLTRHQRPAEFKIFLNGPSGSEFTVSFNTKYLSKVEILDIEPKPEKEKADGAYYTYHFLRGKLEEPTSVTFHLEAMTLGNQLIEVKLDEKDQAILKQFVYP